MVGGIFAFPKALSVPILGTVFADGQILNIVDHPALAAIYGTTFGGNGTTTFGVPDLRNRAIVGAGGEYAAGDTFGEKEITLAVGEMPTHKHSVGAHSGSGSTDDPSNNVLAQITDGYSSSAGGNMSSSMIGETGSSEPHENRQPSFACHWLIQAN